MMFRGAAQIGLGIAIAIAGSACARNNPEFGLGADGGGAGSTTGEDTGPVVPGQQTSMSDSTAGLDDGQMTGVGTTGPMNPTAADSSTSDGGIDTGDVSDSGESLCEVPICEPYGDGCSDAFKCTLFDDGGDGTFEKLGCTELADSPGTEGDECAHDVCGQDDCGIGLACAPAGQGGGVCRALCHDAEDPCLDPEQVCVEEIGPVGLCRFRCQLLLQDCPNGEGCFVQLESAEASCAPASRMNEAGAACDSYNDCAIGLQCISGAAMGGCPDGAPNCCTATCDTTVGATCSADQTCDGLGVPGQLTAGVCL